MQTIPKRSNFPAIALTLASLLIAVYAFLSVVQNYLYAAGPTGNLVNHAQLAKTLQESAEEFQLSEELAGRQAGKYHEHLKVRVDHPGIDNPEILSADQTDLPDSTEVVGVVIDDQACAFVLSEMTRPDRHVVNLMMNDSPISVSYCNFSQCVRAVTSDSDSPIPLGMGGLDVKFKMVLLLDGVRYSQSSAELPLDDVPFSRISLGAWKLQHPKTRIYVGPAIAGVES